MDKHHDHHHAPDPAAAAAGSATVLDPVCGMTVDPAVSPHKAQHDGRDFHFCSKGCKAKFVADPTRYPDKRSRPTSRSTGRSSPRFCRSATVTPASF